MDAYIISKSSWSKESSLRFPEGDIRNSTGANWKGSTLHYESTLHQLAPYIGKMKSSMARTLITTFTYEGGTVYDPFCGSGTVALEAWATGRNIIANDLSPYAFVLTRAKLYPHFSTDEAIREIDVLAGRVRTVIRNVDLRRVPKWVRSFFHPDTLRETIAWFQVLRAKRSCFLTSCLLGILHHQRPGFLSYPSSHTVPYLRQKKYPSDIYPELYQYRPVRERLEKKIMRALRRVPLMDPSLTRECHRHNAVIFRPKQRVDAIITSPPYMKQLDYGRDNRLRLWFLGVSDWGSLDQIISPSETEFLGVFRSCLRLWHNVLTPSGLCVLVLGDAQSRSYDMALPDVVVHIATKEIGGYALVSRYTDPIPNNRRVRRGCIGSRKETILVLRNQKGE